MDDCIEYLRGLFLNKLFKANKYIHSLKYIDVYIDPEDQYLITENSRKLGLVVCRGTQISLISPSDGVEEIANPFLEEDDVPVIES